MKPRTPIKRKTPLKRSKKPIPKVSKKRKAVNVKYSEVRKYFLILHPRCKAKIFPQCKGSATDVHHMAGRGANLLNTDTWIAVCRPCHTWIETHPLEAKEKGWSKSRITKM